MSFSEHGNSDPTTEDMEEEDKVNVEEACVNLACVKKELEEEEPEFEHKQYKIALTFENIFGESSTEQRTNRDSLIGFLDGDVIMETGSVKLEDVKEESKDFIRKTIKQSHCNKCGGNYQGYCLNCSSLSHILNNLTPNLNPEPVLNTTPLNMLEIREISRGCAVFALKTLPKGVILGPFEGVAPIESTTGLQWKIKNKKLINDQKGNWMKYIESVAKHSSRNLEVFQIDGILYFETSREIQEGEELLVCYREEKEEVLKSDKEEVFYLVPVKKEEHPKVFACTFCCLGFRLENCLVEHKSKCAQGDHGGSMEDFEIIQCRCCKVWLEKEEYLESHMLHCLENYNRLSHNLPGSRPTNTSEEGRIRGSDEISPSIDVNASYSTLSTEIIDSNRSCVSDCRAYRKDHFHGDHIRTTHSNISEKEYKCSECSYHTNYKCNLKQHLNTHNDIKQFECDICKKGFTQKGYLKVHTRIQHSNTSEKEYKCSKCSYQTSYKHLLITHLNTHNNIKPFECDICKKGFSGKSYLKVHIRTQHSNTSEKEYKCSECPYQTDFKASLNQHLNIHNNIKPFECDICKKGFNQKGYLKVHIRTRHLNTSEKEYKCSECSSQTKLEGNLKSHLNIHKDIKTFECDTCKKGFNEKGSLKQNIRNHHSSTSKKEYKCSECSYQTNRKENLKRHLNTHSDIKPFECDICKRGFKGKGNLKQHTIAMHLNTHKDIKRFECDICKKGFTEKGNLKKHIIAMHLNTHKDIKRFECDICKKVFNRKDSLKLHIRNHHSNTSEKEYKCCECSYQTNRKSHLNQHLNTHNDIKPFECDICKKGFTRKGYLKQHIRNHHSNSSE